jgi:hypothetical protein
VKLVSTTLTANSAELIADALRSVVEWVDVCLLVDTGVTDATLQVAREVAGDKVRVRTFQWCDDFAAARNFALDAAQEEGGDWSVTVDTDERIDVPGPETRAVLEAATVGCLMLQHESGTYVKERFFRLPAAARFVGPTHEAFPVPSTGRDTLARGRFVEIAKTPEEYRAKFERDVAILERHTRENPGQARWYYYLGDALQYLGRLEDAIRAYAECTALRGWDEEAAWAQYRAAECLCRLGRWADAVDACALGLARHAGIAELAWLAAFAAYRGGKMAQAVWWAKASIALGRFRGCGAEVPRVGFRNPGATYEGPYDVLRFALKALGDEAAAGEAEADYAAAKAARLRGG